MSSVSTNTYYYFSFGGQLFNSIGSLNITVPQSSTFTDQVAFSFAEGVKAAQVAAGDTEASYQVNKSSDANTSFTTDYTSKTFS